MRSRWTWHLAWWGCERGLSCAATTLPGSVEFSVAWGIDRLEDGRGWYSAPLITFEESVGMVFDDPEAKVARWPPGEPHLPGRRLGAVELRSLWLPWNDVWRHRRWGFGVARQRLGQHGVPPAKGLLVEVPFWFVAGVTMVGPAGRAGLWARRRRRVKRGCCAGCGYDLRATPGRCPECGHAGSDNPAT